ncbi:atp-dependent rrna helicase rrp3 [Ceraceosorus bombacis]|uniref:Atp-dependent rrna helicase rrp3 n=1 Tax=Ceraceosorus bombacis TaxID=401625 RepID=A0A0P1BCT4_9BASI|nr:atp-dependent rrna helicase rrp3 [Ceraceosorus bombacis]
MSSADSASGSESDGSSSSASSSSGSSLRQSTRAHRSKASAQHLDDDVSDKEEEDSASEQEGQSGDEVNATSSDPSIKQVEEQTKSFAELGVHPSICEACESMGFKKPTPIQAQAIPEALGGRDIIGLAETGSGKTAAFSIPLLNALWDSPAPFYGLILAPTRELCYQISQQVEGLGSVIGVRCATIVGGMDMMAQSIALGKRPHVIVATPGRLMDHLENTKGFSLRALKFMIMDEADRLLDMDFGPIIDKLLLAIPRDRTTMLFSATMTTRVAKLQRASLRNPIRVEVGSKYQTVSTLSQHYLFMPFAQKDTYLVHLANEQAGQSVLVFTRTVHDAQRVSILLRLLGFSAIPLHGQLSQTARLGALNKFKAGGRAILVATDVASRGLDIPAVDLVVNYDIPTHSKDYIHRVGRTARAGRSGRSVTLVTQYDVELLQRIEHVIGQKLTEFPGCEREMVMLLSERVGQACREAIREMKDWKGSAGGAGKRKRRGDKDDMDRDDDEVQAGMPSRGRGGGGRGRGGGGARGRGGHKKRGRH